MRPYRIKHIPTGLYYKPGDISLSQTGKVYLSNSNILTYATGDEICISCRRGSRLQKATRDKIKWVESKFSNRRSIAFVPRNQFIKEVVE